MQEQKFRYVENLFSGDFGSDYTNRNRDISSQRGIFFHSLFKKYQIKNVLECGCNLGYNLVDCISDSEMNVWGIDIHHETILEAVGLHGNANFVCGSLFDLPFKDKYFDVAFTNTVLIHVPPSGLKQAMSEIHRVSNKYIFCGEYFSEQETIVPWRNQTEALWKRDYKNLWLSNFPDLKLAEEGYKGTEDGFDRTSWWLFSKE